MSEALHLFVAGGLVMYPLVFCSIVVVAIAIERFIYYRKAESNMEKLMTEMPLLLGKNDIQGLKQLLEEDGGFPAMTIRPSIIWAPARIKMRLWKVPPVTAPLCYVTI